MCLCIASPQAGRWTRTSLSCSCRNFLLSAPVWDSCHQPDRSPNAEFGYRIVAKRGSSRPLTLCSNVRDRSSLASPLLHAGIVPEVHEDEAYGVLETVGQDWRPQIPPSEQVQSSVYRSTENIRDHP